MSSKADHDRKSTADLLKGIPASRVNDCWAVDHLLLPVEVQHPQTDQVTRPWLTTVTDCYSRCILGVWVDAQPPSSASVLNGLRDAMMPMRSMPDREQEGVRFRDRHGIPTCLAMDRTKGLEKEGLTRVSEALGFSVLFHPPRKSWLQEKLGGWFGRPRVRALDDPPYALAYEWPDRQRPARVKLPVFALQNVRGMVDCFIEDYHQQKQRSLGSTPTEKWEEGIKEVRIVTVPRPVLAQVLA